MCIAVWLESIRDLSNAKHETVKSRFKFFNLKSDTAVSLAAVLMLQCEECRILIWIMISFHHT